jgi:hypothetical protein
MARNDTKALRGRKKREGAGAPLRGDSLFLLKYYKEVKKYRLLPISLVKYKLIPKVNLKKLCSIIERK